jgi:hypothetical protein
MPSPGIWKLVGRISFWVLIGSVVLSMFGRGRWRFLIPAWAAASLFVDYLVFILGMD